MTEPHPETPALPGPAGSRWRRRAPLLGGAAAVLALMGIGAVVLQSDAGTIALDVPPVAISALPSDSLTAAHGTVAEIFGHAFVLQDASGRALIEEGPAGAGTALVSKGEDLTVIGRLDDGVFHASVLTHADGKRHVIGPLMPPPGPLARAKERLGLWPGIDQAKLKSLVEQSGYTDVRIAGRGPRHLDMVAKGADGRDHDLHVDRDGRMREMSEDGPARRDAGPALAPEPGAPPVRAP